jgi:DNA-binding response OmpR family regulator
MSQVMIIEDESDIAGLLAHCFACEGFQVITAGDGRTGLDLVHLHHPDLVIAASRPERVRSSGP